jgi:hypothetical protein
VGLAYLQADPSDNRVDAIFHFVGTFGWYQQNRFTLGGNAAHREIAQ